MRDLPNQNLENISPTLIIDRQIGEGKYKVFHAFSSDSTQELAVKVFPHNFDQLNYLKEKRIHSKLVHPNIIRFQPQIKVENDQKFDFLLIEYAPFGTLYDLVSEKLLQNENLIRTLFCQLIDGLEYLHNQKIAHLDLKSENLLIGEGYLLKIADFDQAQHSTDLKLFSRGTQNYRAPEVLTLQCKNFMAADMFSVGVILFVMKTGEMPFAEHEGCLIDYDMFLMENDQFWEKKLGTRHNRDFFSPEFKELINGLLRLNPSRRFQISQVKQSKWLKGEILDTQEFSNVMERKWEKMMFFRSIRKSQPSE